MLAFHRRDSLEVAERVSDNGIEKGLIWRESPALLSLSFSAEQVQAKLSIDGLASVDCAAQFEAMVKRMLGLNQDIAAFEARHHQHPQLGALFTRQSGLRVPVATTPFEALTWAIIGQQISVNAAVSIRRKLILSANIRHSTGIFCYPAAQQVARLDENALRQASLSHMKAKTLHSVSEQVLRQQLPLDEWTKALNIEQIQSTLAAVRGIGPWTINYTLLRGYGWLDGSLHGDVAVRRALQRLLDSNTAMSEKEAQNYLAQFAPWRALVGAHLWQSK
jgi:DNA-3-methyladenine glycosylase II